MEKIIKLIQEGRSETLEFIENPYHLEEAFQTLCGFLNCDGGNVLVGVNPDGELVGVNYDLIIEGLKNMGGFSPHILPICRVASYKHKYILHLKMNRPSVDDFLNIYKYRGIAYLRQGTTTSVFDVTNTSLLSY